MMTSEREAARAAERIDQGPAIEEISVVPGQIVEIAGHRFRVRQTDPIIHDHACGAEDPLEKYVHQFYNFPIIVQHALTWLGVSDAWTDPGTIDERDARFWRGAAWGLVATVAVTLLAFAGIIITSIGRTV